MRGTLTRAGVGIAALLVLGSALAQETVYRWRDAGGQLNYGTQPPPGVKAEALGGRGSVTVLPPSPASAEPAAPADPTAARLERLERELEAERQARRDDAERQAAERREQEAQAEQTRAECERRYREPCDEYGQPLAPRYIVTPARPYPPNVMYPPRPRDHRDHRDDRKPHDHRDPRDDRKPQDRQHVVQPRSGGYVVPGRDAPVQRGTTSGQRDERGQLR